MFCKISYVRYIIFEHYCKLQELLGIIKNKINKPINNNNKKIIIFTAFTDTVMYLYEHVSFYVNGYFNLNTAVF